MSTALQKSRRAVGSRAVPYHARLAEGSFRTTTRTILTAAVQSARVPGADILPTIDRLPARPRAIAWDVA